METLKVTDPAKIVTDPVLLEHLVRHNIDEDYVEFVQDYGAPVKGVSSPYVKFYQDKKSSKRFAVFSQLPMVDHEGKKVDVGWIKDGEIYIEKNNLFQVIVHQTQVEIAISNEQPDGKKTGDSLTFNPQLFLDGIERSPVSSEATLLDIDPLNENYLENTLEWDFGICKRRLRIIEGKILGSWLFEKNPNGTVRIKYNQKGDYKLRLGRFKVNDDAEAVLYTYFNEAEYPLTISDSQTFYPDAHAETSSVDGQAYRLGVSESWATIRAGAGVNSNDTNTTLIPNYIWCSTSSSNWQSLYRVFVLFDTSSIPDNCVISAATLSLYGDFKGDVANIAPDVNIYSSNPASNTAIVAADFTALGSTPFCDTPITYNGWSTAGYNDFVLNSSGIAAISKTGVSKFGARNANYDVSGTTPSWVSNADSYTVAYSAEQGTGYKPKLVVTYTTGETKTSSDSGNGTEATSLRELGTVEAGSGAEASLAAAAVIASDGGSGSEMGGLLKGLFSQDAGGGAEGVRMLTRKAGYDLRLQTHLGQVSIPHKEVNL